MAIAIQRTVQNCVCCWCREDVAQLSSPLHGARGQLVGQRSARQFSVCQNVVLKAPLPFSIAEALLRSFCRWVRSWSKKSSKRRERRVCALAPMPPSANMRSEIASWSTSTVQYLPKNIAHSEYTRYSSVAALLTIPQQCLVVGENEVLSLLVKDFLLSKLFRLSATCPRCVLDGDHQKSLDA